MSALPMRLRSLSAQLARLRAELDPAVRPGLGAYAHAGSGIPVIEVAKSRFRTATPFSAGGARIIGPPAVYHRGRDPRSRRRGPGPAHAGRYRLPGELRRAGTLARAGPPAVSPAGRQPG
jgi:deoxyribonuclease V